MQHLKKKILRYLPRPRFTRHRNLKLFQWMNEHAPGRKVLNLGSGVGAFDHLLSDKVTCFNLDIEPEKPGIEVVADAHCLPFADESFDIVYSIAVLEHVAKPWIVAEEITRILKKGGHVVLELPFLNIIHARHDYFRFTDRGIRSLFDKDTYRIILSQVGSGGGSFLSVFVVFYFKQFIPTRFFKFCWLVTVSYPVSLLKYLDIFTDKSKELRLTANSFSFIGKKK